ncbi:MAG: secondary thiamine-phosphate synthase enzyme YjbQ [Thermodesulfovibrionales bacterium]|nr:secondary thiamine-phosphate synthase enzyme YjbQ [Thermodesulfovibrionales bacterium]
MKIKTITVKSKARTEFIDITSEIQKVIDAEGIKNGICFLFVPHTTAGITINEGADPSVQRDVQALLSRLVPQDLNYLHREGNADAHIKSTIVGVDKFIFIEDGRLVLGTWQAIYFCEFDGPRHRRVAVKILSDD